MTFNNKDQIKQQLGTNLPGHVGFEIEERNLILRYDDIAVTKNMQTDDSSFEGWAFALKARLPHLIDTVTISWKEPSNSRDLHYQRFLYRIKKFVENYSWARIEGGHDSDFSILENSKLVMNYPKSCSKADAANLEHKVERKLISLLKNEDPTAITVNHQLPMGIFNEKVSKITEITPRGGSQIDLWKLSNDAITVYELKVAKNMHVGIISELMFYANVINDLRLGKIKYPSEIENGDASILRDSGTLNSYIKEKGNNMKVKGVLLTEGLHTLLRDTHSSNICSLSPGIQSLLNNNKAGISYSAEPVQVIISIKLE